MIDPLTAFAAVQSAVAMIKKAKATVDDVRSLGPMLGSYFEAKQKTIKAVKEAKKAGGSNLSQAVQIEMELLQQEQFEAELKEIFIYSGHAEVWSKIQQRVQDAHRAEIEEARAEEARARRRKKEAKEAAAIFGAMLISAMLLGAILLAVTSVAGCQERYRYQCQDPKNWDHPECKRPDCAINGVCPDQLIKPEDMKGEREK